MKTQLILLCTALSGVAVSQVTLYGQCGGEGWTGSTTCVAGTICVPYSEWYSQCMADEADNGTNPAPEPTAEVSSVEPTAVPTVIEDIPASSATEAVPTSEAAEPTPSAPEDPAPARTLATATRDATDTIAAPSGVTKTLPQSSGTVETDAAIPVSGSFDGGMKMYDRNPSVCQEQTETGEDDAMFILEDGATLSNVILGPGQAEGVHCKGTCTLINVWHSDVCEDAITLKQTSGTSSIIGGGAFHAADKVVQFNGRGTVSIKDFYVEDYGKLVRSCGNCKANGGPRNVEIENVVAVDGGVLCGINTNYGDTCMISGACQSAGKSCDLFEGNDTGEEPSKVGSGMDGEVCFVSGLSESC
ncbi:pectate lyase [Colletotrichum asianum]|uniref:Pectate lyase n=1 Tax=Colletotrichum asianum TaxID=702518 RepID=A0A8H3WNE2_9PEZI|nr:pectate lyase [Colletotrichum asianum]